MYVGPDTACPFSAQSTVRYIGNSTEGLLADVALSK